jgi:HD-like signal output (HDOD) protein
MAPIIDVLAACLARDPAARLADAGALLQALDAAVEARTGLQVALAPESSQATVQFLLRRMQRRQDFPALSRSLVEINRMTAHESKATAGQLATVVLRDFALTNKLLKLANSAFYGVFAGEVKSVSHAIALLGFEQLRITANTLTLFCHITDRARSSGLREMLVRSFVAGLLARHLARALAMSNAEEAFICGMFQTLGETLTMFYFAEEYADIEAVLERERCTRRDATRRVLGIDFATLGAAVAREWRFPEAIVTAIAGLADESVAGADPVAPQAAAGAHVDGARLRDVAVFADAVCEILGRGDAAAPADEIALLCARFEHSLHQDVDTVPRMAAGALGKLDDHAGILGINTHSSRWYQAARRCVQVAQDGPAQPQLRPPETPRSD